MKRNKVRNTYEPKKADRKADTRRKQSKYQGMKIVEHSDLRKFVEKMLYDDQSPANIAGRIKKHEKHLLTVSKDSIYRFIESVYGRRIESHRKKRKKKPSRHRGRLTALSDRTFIDERPKHINARMRIGDVEADFIVSGKNGQGILLVVADRKLRVVFIEQILEVSIANMHQAFLRIRERFPELATITTDNDILFRHHMLLSKLLGVHIYFCHPYHSWEKGTVENVNGVIRNDVPKGSDISQYSKRFIQSVEDKLNRRILECLDYLTPAEALAQVRKRKNARGA